ncbi:MAG TPA: histidine kinase dimerization/phospho-acceptor domain-containing protein [Candidatus Acidoferrales bacterium]|nr:histidine kinase dimerization/phospho-acceptor domain-containing protein [Candidatus Acidoferrales bacterium]
METATAVSAPASQIAILAIEESNLAHGLAREIARWERKPVISILASLQELSEAVIGSATVTALDAALLPPGHCLPLLRSLSAKSPLVLLGPADLHPDVLHLIATGRIEFVPRTGNYIPLAASLIERGLRRAGASSFGFAAVAEDENLAEVFRHEINNPLTGILGNAEMLLAHRDRLRLVDAQRLQTVVDLAVRLRETIRRISDGLEPRSRLARGANAHY